MNENKDYYVEVIELFNDLKRLGHVVYPLSAIAGCYATRFLNPSDCAILLEIESKILTGYEIEKKMKEKEERGK